MEPQSAEHAQRGLYSILATLTSPALQRVRLLLGFPHSMPLFRPAMDTTTLADRAQHADLHAALARPIFSSLHSVTVVLYNVNRKSMSVSVEDLVLGPLDFLRALFAPWCARSIVSLACALHDDFDKHLNAVVDEGKGVRSIKRSGWSFDRDRLFVDLGL